MPDHAMKYAEMAEKVREELNQRTLVAVDLRLAEDELLSAESALVHAYGTFRDALRAAAAEGSERAQTYLDRTTWDLT